LGVLADSAGHPGGDRDYDKSVYQMFRTWPALMVSVGMIVVIGISLLL
jgi:hypothetical protein